jgi:hypothetical protein
MNAAEVRAAFDAAGTDKGHYHGYETVYAQITTPPRTLLELGVEEGRSLAAWRHLWPDCIIWGVEKNPMRNPPQDVATIICQGDAYGSPSPVPTLRYGDVWFDLIIDDADHLPWHQVKGMRYYWQQLRPGGWYVIEDCTPAKHDFLADRLGGGWQWQPDRPGHYEIWWKQK